MDQTDLGSERIASNYGREQGRIRRVSYSFRPAFRSNSRNYTDTLHLDQCLYWSTCWWCFHPDNLASIYKVSLFFFSLLMLNRVKCIWIIFLSLYTIFYLYARLILFCPYKLDYKKIVKVEKAGSSLENKRNPKRKGDAVVVVSEHKSILPHKKR